MILMSGSAVRISVRELVEFILLTMMGGVMIFALYIILMLENVNK